MNLIFTCEERFYRDNKNQYYSSSGGFGDLLWERYLSVFDEVIVLARVCQINDVPQGLMKITHGRVSFVDLPYFIGSRGYFMKRRKFNNKIKQFVMQHRSDANLRYILRVPGVVGTRVAKELRKYSLPYGVEVVGDPWDVFTVRNTRHPLAPVIRCVSYFELRRIVARARAVLYVTKSFLQKRYPSNPNAYTTNASNVVVKIQETNPYLCKKSMNVLKLLSVGSLAQMYKSPDVILHAVATLIRKGKEIRLIWLGDGKYRKEMEFLANKLGIANQVCFKGNVDREQVYQELQNSDIYLHIARTEGLPRALIEAMSYGLPCIGSRAGGIPELLDDSVLLESIQPEKLVAKLEIFINNPHFLPIQSERNFKESSQYANDVLTLRRIEFFNHVKK